MKEFNPALYLVTDRKLSCGRPLISVVEKAIAGGVTLVQLREKHVEGGEFLELARAMRSLTAEVGISLIINDRIDVALAAKADGVHLGQKDIPVSAAREILGPGAIIGISVTNTEQARAAEELDVTYVGVGPVFYTMTKENGRPPIGCEGLSRIREVLTHPIIAIGGIKRDGVEDVMRSGADGIAVVSAIMAAEDPKSASHELRSAVEKFSQLRESSR